jgi:hypothetical protein
MQFGIDLAVCRPGDLVPRDGGEVFACLSASGDLLLIDADINAAQNLQRRFWTRHATAFRLPCSRREIEGREVWVPRPMGKRLEGAMGGPGMLDPTGHETGSARWQKAKRNPKAPSKAAPENELVDADAEEISGLVEEAEIDSGRVEVFFRDPSGIILPADLWYPSRTYWGIVRAKTVTAIKRRLGRGRST